jgi:hypothetical protein
MEKNKLIEKIRDCGLSSAAHGLPNIIRTEHKSVRFVWLVSILLSLISCTLMIYQSFTQFFAYETTSKLDIVYDSANLYLPALTVCSTTYFATPQAKRLLQGFYTDLQNQTRNMTSVKDFDQVYKISMTAALIKPSIMTLKQMLATSLFNQSEDETLKQQLGLSVNEFVHSCSVGGLNQCAQDTIIPFFDWLNGNCVRFNTGVNRNGSAAEIAKQSEPGYLYGLKVNFFLGATANDEFLSMFVDDTSGLIVYIETQGSIPMSEPTQVRVRPGTCAFIGLHKQVSSNLPVPYSTCVSDYKGRRFSQEFASQGFVYKKKSCLLYCKQLAINKACKCVNSGLPIVISSDVNMNTHKNPKYCHTSEETLCSLNLVRDFKIETCDDYW